MPSSPDDLAVQAIARVRGDQRSRGLHERSERLRHHRRRRQRGLVQRCERAWMERLHLPRGVWFRQCAMRISSALALALVCVSLVLLQGESAAGGQVPLDADGGLTLRGADLPTFALIRSFLDHVDDLSKKPDGDLESFLTPFGIPEESILWSRLLDEAGSSVLARRSRLGLTPDDFAAQDDYDRYAVRQQMDAARGLGEHWGRFLAELPAVHKSPQGLMEVIETKYGRHVSLGLSDPADLEHIADFERAFWEGVEATFDPHDDH